MFAMGWHGLLIASLTLAACASTPAASKSPTQEEATPVSADGASPIGSLSYELVIATARLTHAETLKAAGLAHAAGKISDRHVGKVRAAARQTALEIDIAASLLQLYASGAVPRERLDRAILDLNTSTKSLTVLWKKYAPRSAKH